jgi:hypothetical protein
MLFTRARILGLATGASALLAVMFLHGPSRSISGRVLSDREMASIFGDTGGVNNMCNSAQHCDCTRRGTYNGQPNVCQECSDAQGGGSTTPWNICCFKTGKNCLENGGGACGLLKVYIPDNGGDQNSNDCCLPCKPNNAFVPTTTNCLGRNNAGAGADGC